MIKDEYSRWVKDGGGELQHTFEGLNSESVVFDVGMYKGGWSSKISSKYDPYIFGFEPIGSFYRVAEEKFKSNLKVKVCNYGLGNRNRLDTIVINRDSSSLLIKGSCTEQVTIKDISEVITSLDLKKIDLMNLNCEGGEYEILPRLLTTGDINKFKRLLIQFHFIRDGDKILRESLVYELSKTHKQEYCYLSVWEYWTNLE